jgi:predicted nucleic acid-binding protein
LESILIDSNVLIAFSDLISERLDLTNPIDLQAAQLLGKYRISFVDAIIWATAEFHRLVLWTLDRRLANKSRSSRLHCPV